MISRRKKVIFELKVLWILMEFTLYWPCFTSILFGEKLAGNNLVERFKVGAMDENLWTTNPTQIIPKTSYDLRNDLKRLKNFTAIGGILMKWNPKHKQMLSVMSGNDETIQQTNLWHSSIYSHLRLSWTTNFWTPPTPASRKIYVRIPRISFTVCGCCDDFVLSFCRRLPGL